MSPSDALRRIGPIILVLSVLCTPEDSPVPPFWVLAETVGLLDQWIHHSLYLVLSSPVLVSTSCHLSMYGGIVELGRVADRQAPWIPDSLIMLAPCPVTLDIKHLVTLLLFLQRNIGLFSSSLTLNYIYSVTPSPLPLDIICVVTTLLYLIP